MEYNVLNHNNAFCTVTDADIENAVKSGEPLPRAIIQAMGRSHDDKYLEYMYPILYHDVNYMRQDAARHNQSERSQGAGGIEREGAQHRCFFI